MTKFDFFIMAVIPVASITLFVVVKIIVNLWLNAAPAFFGG